MMAEPLTDREMVAFRDGPCPSVARLVEAVDALKWLVGELMGHIEIEGHGRFAVTHKAGQPGCHMCHALDLTEADWSGGRR